jgi:hypothetical protein
VNLEIDNIKFDCDELVEMFVKKNEASFNKFQKIRRSDHPLFQVANLFTEESVAR